MAAIVVNVSPANRVGAKEGRIGIFPGGATTAMYPANTSFWVGYGFAADVVGGADLEDVSTRFELDVDGEPVGWHDFTGRWYDGGRLILSSRAAIQFVEA